MSRSTRALGARSVAASAALLVLAAGLAGCGSSSTTTPAATPGASTSAAKSTAVTDGPVTLVNGWVRSKDGVPPTTGMAGDMSMTGVFGTLTNTTDKEITITGGSSPVAGLVEVHETVKNDAGVMVMQPKAGGFVIPAKGTLELKPGGNHIMLMKMSAMPKIGTSVELTLTTSAGTAKLMIPVRNFAGGDENYVPAGGATTSMSGMNHS